MKEVLPKEFLDNLMMEYNWKRNNLDSNIEFIFYMLQNYTKLRKHLGLQMCEKANKKGKK